MSNEIDYAKPTHHLKDVLFNVKLQDIYSDFRFPNTLFPLPVSSSNHQAVVNQNNGQIISIVSSKYKLISNEKAIEMGKQIFTQLYPNVKTDELIPYKVVAPLSKASVHIDLVSKDVNFKVWDQETWLPYLRCTNSYNRAYALSFEIGFVRKLCSNGVLFNKDTMKLKYLHSNAKRIEVLNDTNQIKATSDLFIDQCKKLREYEIKKAWIIPLVFQVFNINLEIPDSRQITKKLNYLQNLIGLLNALTDQYFENLGANAYAAFNVMTDLVSYQDKYKNLTGFYFDVRSFYTKPTDWLEEFLGYIADKNFEVDEYLGGTIDNLKDMEKKIQLEWMLN